MRVAQRVVLAEAEQMPDALWATGRLRATLLFLCFIRNESTFSERERSSVCEKFRKQGDVECLFFVNKPLLNRQPAFHAMEDFEVGLFPKYRAMLGLYPLTLPPRVFLRP